MSDTVENTIESVQESMEEDGFSSYNTSWAETAVKKDLDSYKTGGSSKSSTIYLPNVRLALLWDTIFNVQFSDGGWYGYQKEDSASPRQLEHGTEYSRAGIVVDPSLSAPRFESYKTHERIVTPQEHFDQVPSFFEKMVYVVRLATGDLSYDMDDLEDDLNLFENMDFDVQKFENCSRCNPELY